MIDVVIRVGRGLDSVRACIASVHAADCETPHRVVVAGDASSDEGLSTWLREEAATGRFELVPHARAASASANEAFALSADRDVVLLASGTCVPPGWLDRLAACARRESRVATVTPMTNRAGACSYPRFLADQPLPAGTSPEELDRHFAAANAGMAVELPTGSAFCLYVTRAALREVGGFDAEAFPQDPAAAVDFCRRAAAAGFRNLACTDVFVAQDGGERPPDHATQAPRLVDERHPDFQAVWRDFVAREPLRPARRRVDIARLRASPRPRVLLVSHGWGGGVEKHVGDLAELLADDCEVLSLRPHGSAVALAWMRAGEEFAAWFDAASQWPALVALLRHLGVARLHLHHVHGLPRDVLDLARALEVPLDVTLHDYFAVCPRYHLGDPQHRTCDEPEGRCDRCLETGPALWGLDLVEWRDAFHAFLRDADRVIAPSADVAMRVHRYFPDVRIEVRGHPDERPAPPRRYKVALLGGLSRIKGAALAQACAADAARRGLPLHFRVVGHVDLPMATWPEVPLSITGSYDDRDLPEVIALERPDAFAFLSQVPETYSYTLTAAMRTGLPILATDHGAFRERLAGYPDAQLVPPAMTAGEINERLMARLAGDGAGR